MYGFIGLYRPWTSFCYVHLVDDLRGALPYDPATEDELSHYTCDNASQIFLSNYLDALEVADLHLNDYEVASPTDILLSEDVPPTETLDSLLPENLEEETLFFDDSDRGLGEKDDIFDYLSFRTHSKR